MKFIYYENIYVYYMKYIFMNMQIYTCILNKFYIYIYIYIYIYMKNINNIINISLF